MELIQEIVTDFTSSAGFVVKVVGSFPACDNDMVFFYAFALLIAVAV